MDQGPSAFQDWLISCYPSLFLAWGRGPCPREYGWKREPVCELRLAGLLPKGLRDSQIKVQIPSGRTDEGKPQRNQECGSTLPICSALWLPPSLRKACSESLLGPRGLSVAPRPKTSNRSQRSLPPGFYRPEWELEVPCAACSPQSTGLASPWTWAPRHRQEGLLIPTPLLSFPKPPDLSGGQAHICHRRKSRVGQKALASPHIY